MTESEAVAGVNNFASPSPNGPVLAALGSRVAGLTGAGVSEHGREVVRTALIDTLAVALAGTRTDSFLIAQQALTSSAAGGPSLVLGSRRRISALDAAMLNGIAAHSLDFDDGNRIVLGHPSGLLVPTVLAIGEELDAAAPALVAAYAAGFEVMVRIARGINPVHSEQGWHPTSTIGVFGVAAAAAHLYGLDADRVTTALAIAASMASGIKANFGTMVKALHVGHAVRSGITCAKLAAAGFTADPGAFEAKQGFLRVYHPGGEVNSADVLADLDGDYEINIGDNGIKAFPCCGSTHSPIHAALAIHRQHRPDPADIASIRIVLDSRRIPHTDRPELTEPLAGKYSLQYVVARALVSGRVGLDHFAGQAHRDPQVRALMGRVELVPATTAAAQAFDAEVTVEMTGGSRWHASAADRERPGTSDSPILWDKFDELAGAILGTDGLAAARVVLREFPGPVAARPLAAMFQGPANGGTSAIS